jgi:hypothetical protein
MVAAGQQLVALSLSSYSIGATDFVALNFGYAAGTAIGWHGLARL